MRYKSITGLLITNYTGERVFMAEDWKNTKKGENTRKRILHAAKDVFSKHPYHSASVRMVGKAGNFDHPIIHYYFPKKAGLFDAVVENLLEELKAFDTSWFEGLGKFSVAEAFDILIDRVFEFHYKSPELFRTVMQNTAYIEDYENFPAAHHYSEFHESFIKTFNEKIAYKAPPEDASKFIYSFTVLATNYLGASTTYSEIMNIEENSDEYKSWVKDTLAFILLPRLEKLVFGDSKR